MSRPLIVNSTADIRRNGFVYEQALQTLGNAATRAVSFSELAEEFPEEKVPFLDRRDVDEPKLTALQRHWREHGYVVIPQMISESLIAEYEALRIELKLGKAFFDTFTPYLDHDVIRRITLSERMHQVLTEILGQDMGLHFVLTAYHSTERGWHQDDYLNPDDVYSNYCAAWISLGDISPDAGPFEFVDGSHKWPCVRRHLVQRFLSEEHASTTDCGVGGKGHWAAFAETYTNQAYVQEIERQGCTVSQFLGGPGDVLIWHGKLVHRGSAANHPTLARPAMISHFSGTGVRTDIGTDIRRYGDAGCHYWHFDRPSAR